MGEIRGHRVTAYARVMDVGQISIRARPDVHNAPLQRADLGADFALNEQGPRAGCLSYRRSAAPSAVGRDATTPLDTMT